MEAGYRRQDMQGEDQGRDIEPWRPGAGIIIIDKPRGPSSHQVTAWVRDLLHVPAGHSGTLDPGVSGILVIMLGNAARLAPVLLNHEKEYVCLMRLHQDVARERLDQILAEFQGRIYQRPPRKSAVARRLRIRTILQMEVLDVRDRLVLLRIRCDAGTYIRSLCHHIGLALGTGAHMQELRRTRSGPFGETDAHNLQELVDACSRSKDGDASMFSRMLLPVQAVTASMPRVVITDAAIDAICHGAGLAGVGVISASHFQKNDTVAIFSKKEELIGLGEAIVPSSSIRPGKHGLVIAPRAVFMKPGTYPRCWKKSSPVEPFKRASSHS